MDKSEILLMRVCDVLPSCEGPDETGGWCGVSARPAVDPPLCPSVCPSCRDPHGARW